LGSQALSPCTAAPQETLSGEKTRNLEISTLSMDLIFFSFSWGGGEGVGEGKGVVLASGHPFFSCLGTNFVLLVDWVKFRKKKEKMQLIPLSNVKGNEAYLFLTKLK